MTQLLEILEKLNPWWQEKSFDVGMTRDIYLSKINSCLKAKEIVVLTGVRRSGKTTLLLQTVHHLIHDKKVDPKKILFVNFDEPDISNLDNPIKEVLDIYAQEVCSEKSAYLIFDEVQNIEAWEKWAKSIYDRKEHQLILSGSSSHILDPKLAALLSGRYLKVTVFPLNFAEYLFFNNLPTNKSKLSLISNKNKIMNLLKKYLGEGGFPRIVLEKDVRLKTELLKTYYESLIYKDIVSLYEIRNIKALKELIYYLCSNFTSLFSYKKLSEILKVDFLTLKDYFHYLEESKLLFEMGFFSYSLKTQARNNKKIYCVDNGLRNAVSFKFSKDEGKLAENLIFIELKRREKEVYYWKDKGEIDFVVKNNNQTLTAINVSYTNQLEERETRALMDFKEKFRKKVKELIVITKDVEKETEGIKFIPLWKWLLRIK